MLHNIHVWNGLHKVSGIGPGIHIGPGGSLTRISGCYFDNTWLNIVDPSRATVLGSLFYQANTVLVSGPRSSIAGLTMRDNVYSGPLNSSNVEISGEFQQGNVTELRIEDEIQLPGGSTPPNPTAATSVSQARSLSGTSAIFEFHTDHSQPRVLLFPWIDFLSVSVAHQGSGGGFIVHRTEVNGSAVTVRLEAEVDVTVYVTAALSQ